MFTSLSLLPKLYRKYFNKSITSLVNVVVWAKAVGTLWRKWIPGLKLNKEKSQKTLTSSGIVLILINTRKARK